jgi:hypothetical protein
VFHWATAGAAVSRVRAATRVVRIGVSWGE